MHLVYSIKNLSERRAAWQTLVTQWRQSSLKCSAFCRQHQVKPKDLHRWRYRIMNLELAESVCNSTPALIPVQLVESQPASTLSLQHRSGFTLIVDQQTDAHLFKQVTAWLQEAAC